jgi:hypothetical protein
VAEHSRASCQIRWIDVEKPGIEVDSLGLSSRSFRSIADGRPAEDAVAAGSVAVDVAAAAAAAAAAVAAVAHEMKHLGAHLDRGNLTWRLDRSPKLSLMV